jgi:hypothetical protein
MRGRILPPSHEVVLNPDPMSGTPRKTRRPLSADFADDAGFLEFKSVESAQSVDLIASHFDQSSRRTGFGPAPLGGIGESDGFADLGSKLVPARRDAFPSRVLRTSGNSSAERPRRGQVPLAYRAIGDEAANDRKARAPALAVCAASLRPQICLGLRGTLLPSREAPLHHSKQELRESAFPSREAVNLLNDRVFSCRKSLFLVERSTIR